MILLVILFPLMLSNLMCSFFHATTRDEKHWPEREWRNLIEKLTALSIQVRLPWGNEKEKTRAERLAVGLSHVVVCLGFHCMNWLNKLPMQKPLYR